MSLRNGVGGTVSLQRPAPQGRARAALAVVRAGAPPRELAPRARVYWWTIAAAATVVVAATIGEPQTEAATWQMFALLTFGAAATQLFAVHTRGNRVFHVAILFVIAATMLLPPILVAAMCVLQHIPDWLRHRYRWYIQTFNICNYSLCGIVAATVFDAVPADLAPGQAETALRGLAAAAVFMFVNRALLACMLQLARGLRPRESGLLDFEDLAVESVLAVIGVGLAISLLGEPWMVPLSLAPLVVIYYLQVQARQISEASVTIQSQNDSLAEVNQLLRTRSLAAMEGLAATVDARDAYTAGHTRRVRRISLLLGERLGLGAAELEVLGAAALFHDIGKIAIPDSVLLKPAGLDDAEWVVMRTHAEEGARIIGRLGFLDGAVPAIRHHHERMDGTGYPDGLVGERIPLGARIIHVADAVDSMLTHRVYRDPREASEVLDEVRARTGSQFCPRCVEALDALIAEHGIDVIIPLDAAVQRVPSVPASNAQVSRELTTV
jgi:putative nucleotidyltransferase with HDIG domain